MAGLESEADHDGESRPLLQDNDGLSRASSSTLAKGPDASSDEEAGSITSLPPSRDAEDDVLPETSPLGRTVTWGSAYIIVISRVIGSGIFATPGSIVRAVGSPGLALLLWVAGAVVASCGLAVSLEYGCMLPRSGGHKVYLEFTYRHPRFLASTLIATHIILLGFSASNCVIFSRYTLFALGLDADVSDFWRKAVAVGLLTVITIIHGCLPKLGIRIQNWLGWMKVGLIIFMILSGIYVVIFREISDIRVNRPLPVWDDLWKGSVWNWGTISVAYFQVIYSYSGLDNVNNILNEVKDPIRTLPSITSTALFTAASLYTLINVAYFLVVPIDEIKGSGEMIAALFFERLFGHHIGGIVLPLAIALSVVGNVMVVIFAQARLKQEIARQGFLPFSELLSSTRPFHSPLGGLFVHFIPSFLVIVVPPSSDVYSFILSVEGYPGQFVSIAVGGGLLWLRFKRPDLQRPFKAWIPAVIVTLGLSSSLIMAPFFAPGGFPAYAIVGLSM